MSTNTLMLCGQPKAKQGATKQRGNDERSTNKPSKLFPSVVRPSWLILSVHNSEKKKRTYINTAVTKELARTHARIPSQKYRVDFQSYWNLSRQSVVNLACWWGEIKQTTLHCCIKWPQILQVKTLLQTYTVEFITKNFKEVIDPCNSIEIKGMLSFKKYFLKSL